MDPVTLMAGTSAAAAGAFLALRANMLKPEYASWPEAPRCVRWATFGLSVVFGGYATAVFIGGHGATGMEATLTAAMAGYAFLLWLNLYRQVRAHG